jgi:hypothetical protein
VYELQVNAEVLGEDDKLPLIKAKLAAPVDCTTHDGAALNIPVAKLAE